MPAVLSDKENIIARRLELLIADAKTADLKQTVATLELAAFLVAQDIKCRQETSP